MKEITNAYRDEFSGAVIMDDSEAFAAARKRKELAQDNRERKAELSDLREQVQTIQSQLNEIIRYMKHA